MTTAHYSLTLTFTGKPGIPARIIKDFLTDALEIHAAKYPALSPIGEISEIEIRTIRTQPQEEFLP